MVYLSYEKDSQFSFLGVLLSGCGLVAQPASLEETPIKVYSGVVTGRSGSLYLKTTDEKSIEITSKKVDLESMVGKQITVEGQYSGTTLYVDLIK